MHRRTQRDLVLRVELVERRGVIESSIIIILFLNPKLLFTLSNPSRNLSQKCHVAESTLKVTTITLQEEATLRPLAPTTIPTPMEATIIEMIMGLLTITVVLDILTILHLLEILALPILAEENVKLHSANARVVC